MPNWLRASLEWLHLVQTWIFIFTVGVPTGWATVTAYTANLPPYQVLLYGGGTFALFAGGMLFTINIYEWSRSKLGRGRACRQLRELAKRNHTDMAIARLAEVWAGRDRDGTTSTWIEWNTRLRDLKAAAEQGVLEVTKLSSKGTVNMNARVSLASAVRFLEAGGVAAQAKED